MEIEEEINNNNIINNEISQLSSFKNKFSFFFSLIFNNF